MQRRPHRLTTLVRTVSQPKAKAKPTAKCKPKPKPAAKKSSGPENEIAIDEQKRFEAKKTEN